MTGNLNQPNELQTVRKSETSDGIMLQADQNEHEAEHLEIK